MQQSLNKTQKAPSTAMSPTTAGLDTGDRRRNDSREKLKQAAIELFFEHGFEATSIRQIVSACDLSPPAFYNHFDTKDDLLREIIHEGHVQAEEMMNLALEGAGVSPTERLRELIAAYVRFHTHHQLQALVVNSEFRCLKKTHLSDTLAERIRLRGLIQGVIEEGVSAGHFDLAGKANAANAIRMATIAIGDMSLRVASWFDEKGELEREEVEAFYADFALRLVGAQRAGTSS
ncbi:MAG: TetR/AcrR family transcriptional regulator [Pseudomonadota bacterium]